jgi:hypothetical protein
MTRIGSIAKGHPVFADEADPGAVAFAKAFIADAKGGWREPRTKTARTDAKDAKAEASFKAEWTSESTRHGFGGSGTAIYTNRWNGSRFEVDVTAGTGDFWSSNYRVTRLETIR